MTEHYEKENNTCYTVEQFKKDILKAPRPISIGKKLNDFLQVDFGIGGATAIINDVDMSLRINLLRNILIHNPNHKVAFFTWEKSAYFVYKMLLSSYRVDNNIELISPNALNGLTESLTDSLEYKQQIDNNLKIFDCHPRSFSAISNQITRYLENNKNEISTTIFIDDIFTPHEPDEINDYQRFNIVSDWFLRNKIHIFLGFNWCKLEKREKIMNGNMRNVLEYRDYDVYVHKNRHGPTGVYSCLYALENIFFKS